MSEQNHDEEIEQNFNDSELEDIMSEIENLEKEFSTDAQPVLVNDTKPNLESITHEDLAGLDDTGAHEVDMNLVAEKEAPAQEEAAAQTPVVEASSNDDVKFEDISSIDEVQDEFQLIQETNPEELEKLKVDSFEVNKTKLQEDIDDEVSTFKEETVLVAPVEELKPDTELEAQLGQIAQNHHEDKVNHVVDEEIVANNLVSLKDENMSKPSDKQVSEMNFAVSGNMCMKMNFNLSGKNVVLLLDDDNGLSVELPGGIKFSVPLEEKKAS